MSSRGSRDVYFHNHFNNHGRNTFIPVRQWIDQLVRSFLTKKDKNSFLLRNTSRFRWGLYGDLSVSELGRGFTL